MFETHWGHQQILIHFSPLKLQEKTHQQRINSRASARALSRADDRNRNRDYPDVERSSTAQLLCLGVETYGRWGDHSITLVRQLARYRSRNSPDYVRASVEQCSNNRWWGLLSVAVQCIVAEGILRLQGADLHAAGDSVEQLILEDLLHMHPWALHIAIAMIR